jgi:hypothetical protein
VQEGDPCVPTAGWSSSQRPLSALPWCQQELGGGAPGCHRASCVTAGLSPPTAGSQSGR